MFEESGDIGYFVNRNEEFRDKRVLIVGGGDSAVDWALTLEPIAREITLIHRSENFRAHAKSVEQMMASRVDVNTYCETTSSTATRASCARSPSGTTRPRT